MRRRERQRDWYEEEWDQPTVQEIVAKAIAQLKAALDPVKHDKGEG